MKSELGDWHITYGYVCHCGRAAQSKEEVEHRSYCSEYDTERAYLDNLEECQRMMGQQDASQNEKR
jgi:hypothetical protein